MKYKCNNIFKVRVPYNSVYDYYSNFENNIVNYTKKNFMENLLVSSNSLYREICNKNNSRKTEKSILKYLIRSSIRTTPYGLNSAILEGTFDKKDFLKFNRKDFCKHARPDMEWLVKVVKILEELYFDKLFVCVNNTFETNEFKNIKLWNSAYLKEENEVNNIISINNTSVVKLIFNKCREYIPVTDLIKLITEKYENVDYSVIYSLLKVLINNEFLLTNLRIPIQNPNPFKEILNFFDEIHIESEFLKKLNEIYLLFDEYNQTNISEGIEIYKSLIERMQNIVESENYLQIDMYIKKKIYLNEDIKKEIEDFSELIDNLMNVCIYKEYINKFQEKYGNVAVKYLDVIDNEKGLGIPRRSYEEINKYKFEMIKLISKHINRSKDYYLNLEDIKQKKNSISNIYNRELSFYLINQEKKYRLYCSPLFGSNNKENSIGRFQYLFNSENINIENGLINLSFIPQNSRHINVAMYESRSFNYIEYGIKSRNEKINKIDINDIYMFIDKDKIKFLNKSNYEILEFNTPNMLNDTFYPPELKPLYDVCINQRGSVYDFYMLIQELLYENEGKYNPIVYKDIIIMPTAWKIDFSEKDNITYIKFVDYLKEYKEKYDLSDFVLAGVGDQKLLLDLTDDCQKEILFNFLKKEKSMLLYENIFEYNDLVLLDENNKRYVSEFIFSLEKQKYEKKYQVLPLVTFDSLLMNSSNIFDEWLSFKLYFNEYYENIVISEYIEYLFKKLFCKNIVQMMFFIRYKDMKNHLRLRVKCSEEDKIYVLKNIKEVVNNLLDVKILNDFICDTYTKEYERYGGIKCILNAENLFSVDSYFCCEVIKMKKEIFTSYSFKQIYMISVLKLFEDAEIMLEDQEKILYVYNNISIDNKEYYKHIDKFKDILDCSVDDYLRKTAEGIQLYLLLNDMTESIKKYINSLIEEYKIVNNSRIHEAILSILHM